MTRSMSVTTQLVCIYQQLHSRLYIGQVISDEVENDIRLCDSLVEVVWLLYLVYVI